VQLPPSLSFAEGVVSEFLTALRDRFAGLVVCEPRHASWFTPQAEQLLTSFQIARVAADPAVVPQAGKPGGSATLVYYRLHGSPRVYFSAYGDEFLQVVDDQMRAVAEYSVPAWCIFDNTAEGEATRNAVNVWSRLKTL
jgi:uncharacterized protein YecE (DUF72 family)